MKTIRVWNLGYIDRINPLNSIIPTKEAIAKLRNLIKSEEGSTMDLIWGPDLSLTVHTYDDTQNEVTDFITDAEGKLVEL